MAMSQLIPEFENTSFAVRISSRKWAKNAEKFSPIAEIFCLSEIVEFVGWCMTGVVMTGTASGVLKSQRIATVSFSDYHLLARLADVATRGTIRAMSIQPSAAATGSPLTIIITINNDDNDDDDDDDDDYDDDGSAH